jgi:hypothetical protein
MLADLTSVEIQARGRLYYATKHLFWRKHSKNGWSGQMLIDEGSMVVNLFSEGDRE